MEEPDSISVSAKCKCGGTLVVPDGKPLDGIVTCAQCGAEAGTYGDLKAHMIELAKAEAQRLVKDAFKGIGGKY